MSFPLDALEVIHLEITDKCNASCPMCARNIFGGKENPYLPKSELSLVDIKKILPPNIVKRLKRLYMCGNFGDPITAKDTLATYQYLRKENSEIKLSLNTNGSLKDSSWWKSLGETIGQKGDVKFGIDGLLDTHQLYRKGTHFDKILKNAEAFINAGGKAVWEFIIFKHNEHQVDEAQKLAKEMGFHRFQAKKTGRFFSNSKMKGKDKQEVHNSSGELLYYLEKPTIKEYQNKSLSKEDLTIQKFGTMEKYFDETPIECKTAKEGSLYISSEGLVFPCCWTANQLYLWYMTKESGPVWELLNRSGGKIAISALENPIEEIVQGLFFNEISSSWGKKSCADGKLKVCAKTCGQDFDQFKDQYE